MNTLTVWQKVADHFRAFMWSGRPAVIRYLDRNNYFSDPTKFGGGEGMVTDGNCTVRHSISTIRIFLPILPDADRLDVLRHESGHIRYSFAGRLTPAAGAEARALWRQLEPEDAALYDAHPDGRDVTPEAVVRLADRVRSGQRMPPMSAPLAKLVRVVVAPAPASALAFVLVAALAVMALASSVSAESYYATPTGEAANAPSSSVHVYEYDGRCLRVEPKTAVAPTLQVPSGGMAELLNGLPGNAAFRSSVVNCDDYRTKPDWSSIVYEQTPAPEYRNIGLVYYPL